LEETVIAPTWQRGDASLYLGDCLDILPQLETGSVDAVVTDPPYPGLKGGYPRDIKFGGVANAPNNVPTIGVPWGGSLEWMHAAWQLARYGMVVFCSFHSVCMVRQEISGAKPMGLVTWLARNSPPTGKNVPRYDTQFIWLLNKQPGIKWDAFGSMLIDTPFLQAGCFATERILREGTKAAAHPTQKPVALMRALLVDGMDSVIDPFAGTGTTGVACVQTGRRFIGIELDAGYFEIAVKRIEAAMQQGRLL
jgi:site-specific DNA-methyltransferase (adenine-specific)